MDQLVGAIERITFYSEDTGYSVVKITPSSDEFPEDAESYDGTITVVGVMPEMATGESAQFSGKWVVDPRYGKQFKAETVLPVTPNSKIGIVSFLSSGLVNGIGPVTAEKIYNHFGDQTIEILDTAPDRIHEVPTLKTKLANNLIEAWGKSRAKRQIMIQLQGYGLTSKMASTIYEQYGNEAMQVLRDDPYQLTDDIKGVGFKKADLIARRLGMPTDSPARIRAGVHYALSQLAQDGHTYAPRSLVIDTAEELLDVSERERIAASLQGQVIAGKLFQEKIGEEENAMYLPLYYYAELGASQHLRIMNDTQSKMMFRMGKTDWDDYLSELAEDNNIELTPQQQGAVKAAMTSKISVLTGGPGTGKTTTLQMVIHALEDEGFDYALASPTGRAAKRLAEATSRHASTIHRLMGFNPDGYDFLFNEDHPLDVDMLIVDESSMIDLLLFNNMLKALKPSTHLMLVGDVDQLPSVGAGNVLRDVIDSGIAHVTRLTQIFRQGGDSHIIVNAHRINQGQQPFTDNTSEDFFFFNVADSSDASEMIVDIVKNRIPEKFGFDSMDDVQVLAPMYRGAIGINTLNQALQQTLNGDRRLAEQKLNGVTYRVGDKVMQTRNNYEKDVYNGDIGRIHAIDYDDNLLEVVIDGRIIYYDFTEVDELMHAYCISTHRSQGSEYPVVVMPVATDHYIMLQRNLLYTAITRAKKLVVLVGTRKALAIAVNNNQVAERYTGLAYRLGKK